MAMYLAAGDVEFDVTSVAAKLGPSPAAKADWGYKHREARASAAGAYSAVLLALVIAL